VRERQGNRSFLVPAAIDGSKQFHHPASCQTVQNGWPVFANRGEKVTKLQLMIVSHHIQP
jgi:hypothetical protein